MHKIIHNLLDLLFPPKCPFCRAILKEKDRAFGACHLCNRMLPRAHETGVQTLDGVTECVSVLCYKEEVRDAIRRFKFSGRAAYATVFAKLMAEAMEDYMEGGFDLITWVPLSKKRLRERGYDQAKLLALELASITGMEAHPLLKKEIHTTAQSLLTDDSARRANVAGAYCAVNPNLFAGKRVLLVDDVLTTGATLSECAVTLLAAGAAEVRAVTLAKAFRDEKRV